MALERTSWLFWALREYPAEDTASSRADIIDIMYCLMLYVFIVYFIASLNLIWTMILRNSPPRTSLTSVR